MDSYLLPRRLHDALELRAEHPEATVLAGGTDLMVAVNEGRRDLGRVLDVSAIDELTGWSLDGDTARIGSAVPLARVVAELGHGLPGLAQAARLVGSPPIRHRATLGGNIGTASPAGDALLPLVAADARIELCCRTETRWVSAREFFLGPGRNGLRADELIVAVHMPWATSDQFAKTGTRRAMVISTAGAAAHVALRSRRIGIALGSVAPTPVAATAAERFAAAHLDWAAGTEPDDRWWSELQRLVTSAATPIDDVRDTAEHRRRAVGVLARRCLRRAWTDAWNPRRYTQC